MDTERDAFESHEAKHIVREAKWATQLGYEGRQEWLEKLLVRVGDMREGIEYDDVMLDIGYCLMSEQSLQKLADYYGNNTK